MGGVSAEVHAEGSNVQPGEREWVAGVGGERGFAWPYTERAPAHRARSPGGWVEGHVGSAPSRLRARSPVGRAVWCDR
jgi:hypothetical protein